VEVPIQIGVTAFTSGGTDAVVTGDGEGLLQLQEVGGVPLDGLVEEGTRRAVVVATSRGRRRWQNDFDRIW
jgi:hypothetical protein